jgi:ribosome biogenesis GTPase
LLKGIVIKSTGSWFLVKTEDGKTTDCRIRGKFRLKDLKSTNPVAVGDLVDFEIPENDTIGVITNIHERKNYIIRKASNLSKQHQIVASNVDQIFLVVTAIKPETSLVFIDRFLISAEAYRIPVIIVINKSDIYIEEHIKAFVQDVKNIYEPIGYKCIETSVVKNINIETLKDLMKNRISVFAGNSGVGKSSLINKIDSNLSLKIGKISDAHFKGKHTTTYAEMFEVASGGSIIDTPGIKGFGLIEFEKSVVHHYFPEIFKVSENCQYNNCTHTHEPKCAVKEAVENEKISSSRYESYLTVLEDSDTKHRL